MRWLLRVKTILRVETITHDCWKEQIKELIVTGKDKILGKSWL